VIVLIPQGDSFCDNTMTFQCEQCGKTYNASQHLKRHMEVQHDDAAPRYVCDECTATFGRQDNLFAHKRNIHSKTVEAQEPEPPVSDAEPQQFMFRCAGCNDRFPGMHKLREHRRSGRCAELKDKAPAPLDPRTAAGLPFLRWGSMGHTDEKSEEDTKGYNNELALTLLGFGPPTKSILSTGVQIDN
jgi:hypothetical protein